MMKRVMVGLMCLPLIVPPPISNPQFKAEIINHKEQIGVRNIKDVEQEIREQTNQYLLDCYMEQIIDKHREKLLSTVNLLFYSICSVVLFKHLSRNRNYLTKNSCILSQLYFASL